MLSAACASLHFFGQGHPTPGTRPQTHPHCSLNEKPVWCRETISRDTSLTRFTQHTGRGMQCGLHLGINVRPNAHSSETRNHTHKSSLLEGFKWAHRVLHAGPICSHIFAGAFAANCLTRTAMEWTAQTDCITHRWVCSLQSARGPSGMGENGRHWLPASVCRFLSMLLGHNMHRKPVRADRPV